MFLFSIVGGILIECGGLFGWFAISKARLFLLRVVQWGLSLCFQGHAPLMSGLVVCW